MRLAELRMLLVVLAISIINSLVVRLYEFAVNAWSDAILDQREFVEVRSRLGFRE